LPRLTVAKLQARIRQLDAALKHTGELHAKLHKRYETDRLALVAALQDAVKIIDEERAGKKSAYTLEDIKRLEAIRFLSLGV
jgi:hypothetical protein